MKLAIVAGEASGDLHASEVVRELKALDPALETFGIGGDLLAAEGMRILHHAREMGIVGLFNVLRNYPMFRRIFDDTVQAIAAEKPDAVLLIDYPGFNLRLARRCREMGLRVIYYISPQVWAWRRGRVKQIARDVDRMIVILPFEEDFYREHGVPVTHAGHPLIDELAGVERGDRPPGDPLRVALLPGSRRGEVAALLPPMLDAVALLQNCDAFVIQAPTIAAKELVAIMSARGTFVCIVPHGGGQAIADADVALSSSGTATLECAVIGTPVVVMYRLTAITHWLAKRLVKLPHFGLINIIAGRDVVPELIQHHVNGARIAAEVRRLAEPEEHARVRGALAEVKRKLGGPGASRRAAEAIMAAVRA
ncbi:MAG: lipid-A-disaccharide synthase [Acidobacteriota bacterium]